MEIWKKSVLFYAGGLMYMGLEFLWRGWSHGIMFLTGGVCFILLGSLQQWMGHRSVILRGIAGAAAITVVELGTGLLCNRSYQIWDYREMPGNFRGQICAAYCLLWIPVAVAGEEIFFALSDMLPGKETPVCLEDGEKFRNNSLKHFHFDKKMVK